jgi:hypothetical protein
LCGLNWRRLRGGGSPRGSFLVLDNIVVPEVYVIEDSSCNYAASLCFDEIPERGAGAEITAKM